MPWLKRVLAVVGMAPESGSVIDYAAFLSGFFAAKLEVLHVVEGHVDVHAPASDARSEAHNMFFRLVYRSNKLRRALDGHAAPAARGASLQLGVGSPGQILCEAAASGEYQVVVIEQRGPESITLAKKLMERSTCSVVAVSPQVRIPFPLSERRSGSPQPLGAETLAAESACGGGGARV